MQERETTILGVDERRESTRFEQPADTYFAILNLPGAEPILGEVADESLGGLGLLFRDRISLAIGDRVELVYLGQILDAEVRHLDDVENGMRRVGFECASRM